MSAARITLIFLITLPLHASPDRILKYQPVLDTTSVLREMGAMVDDSTLGPDDIEIAAFLVINKLGEFELERWNNSAKSRKQTFTGVIPPRTVGIVHTHPNEWARPSRGDREEAKRIGLPIYVVTRWDIWVVEPDGHELALIDNVNWRGGLKKNPSEARWAESREQRATSRP